MRTTSRPRGIVPLDSLNFFVADMRTEAAWGAGMVLAFATNLMNNLPAGLIAGDAVEAARNGRELPSTGAVQVVN